MSLSKDTKMGAYFQATVNKKRYSTWATDNGAKLLEHGYVGNDYVEKVLWHLLDNPSHLVWLCDYHEGELTWDNVPEAEMDERSWALFPTYYILNQTKGEVIDLKKLIGLSKERRWIIHPLVVLCNSDKEAQGGGDYRKDDPRRASWADDLIEITYDEEKATQFNHKDVTEENLFYEGE